MKMYYFSKGGYNEEFHVMAKSKEDALRYLKIYLLKQEQTLNSPMLGYYIENFDYFSQHPECIYEFEEGVVIQTEVS